MKTRGIFLVTAMAVVMAVAAYSIALAEGNHKFVGVKKCSMCHKSEAKGNQHGKWLGTSHAKAYERLASPEAQETAKKAGVSGDPQKEPKCLKCHVTAYGVDSSLLTESFVQADGVQCEACHGAGSDYLSLSVMKDTAKSVAAGLIIPTKEVCVQCHNPESPNYKEFNYEESLKKVAHPRPKE